MRRVCFVSRVKPDLLEEYRTRHEAVWPEMLDALHEAGWHNYSLFLSSDGLLVGYLETEDFEAAQAAMASTSVNERWQAEMARYFIDESGRPDEGFVVLDEVFNINDQRKKAAQNHG
jgi:L-rhamnose mutarotase